MKRGQRKYPRVVYIRRFGDERHYVTADKTKFAGVTCTIGEYRLVKVRKVKTTVEMK